MPCYHPITAHYSGKRTAKGEREIIFNGTEQQHGPPIILPCGRCIGCHLERSRQWAMRCVHETQLHPDNMFVTLTYSDEHIMDDGSLVPSDLQLFHKRLHNRLLRQRGTGIRYFACGEYGDTSDRPHYHTLIFGYTFPDAKRLKRSKTGEWLYTSKILDELWPFGHANFGGVTFESAAYVARYTVKKILSSQFPDYYMGRVPEYGVMSRRPGIGTEWFNRYGNATYDYDTVVLRGKEMPPPKFYDKKLKVLDTSLYEAVKKKRSRRPRNRAEQKGDRLKVREKVQQARINLYKRNAT